MVSRVNILFHYIHLFCIIFNKTNTCIASKISEVKKMITTKKQDTLCSQKVKKIKRKCDVQNPVAHV